MEKWKYPEFRKQRFPVTRTPHHKPLSGLESRELGIDGDEGVDPTERALERFTHVMEFRI
jgi:hypothetical protein